MPIRSLPGATTLLLVLLAGSPSEADDLQLWTAATASHRFGDRVDASLQLQTRFIDDISTLGTVIVRPNVGYRLSKHGTASLGYDYVGKPQSSDDVEQRVWQQLGLTYDADAFGLANRLRIEQRFIDNVNGVTVRLRNRVRLTRPLADSEWRLIASDEIFANLNQNSGGPPPGFDQNRLFGGVGYRIGADLRLEAGYQWRLNRSSSDHILVMNLLFDS